MANLSVSVSSNKDIERYYTRTGTGIQIAESAPFDVWLKVGRLLLDFREWERFARGDWINAGQHLYGDKYLQASSLFGGSEQTLRNICHVSRHVPDEIRRRELSWSHHRSVALKEKTLEWKTRWLQRAIDERMTTEQLRLAIAEEKAIEDHALRSNGFHIPPPPPPPAFPDDVQYEIIQENQALQKSLLVSQNRIHALEQKLAEATGEPVQDLILESDSAIEDQPHFFVRDGKVWCGLMSGQTVSGEQLISAPDWAHEAIAKRLGLL